MNVIVSYKSIFLSSLLLMTASSAAQAEECDVRLDNQVIDATFSWSNNDLEDVVAVFERVEAGVYQLQGTYEKNYFGDRYSYFRNYFVEWPTFRGRGQFARIREIRFGESQWGCTVQFVGQRYNPRSEELEFYDASYSETASGLNIYWSEITDFLRFSSVKREQIDL